MPGGGARPGAGRPKISPLDPITLCCGAVFEKTIAFDRVLRDNQLSRQIVSMGEKAVVAYEDLKEIRSELARIPLENRKAYVKQADDAEKNQANPANRINDAGYVIKENIQRVWPSHKVSNADLAYARSRVRSAVLEQFGIELSPRQIRVRVKIYQKAMAENDF